MQKHNSEKGKSTLLKDLLVRKEIGFIMEAHSALSGRIVEEAGFEAIWASGLTISSLLGVRDRNEISWTQVLDVVEYISDATTIPILLDGDTGHGDFNNFSRLVKKLVQRKIGGVCIEDKLFPKVNSFIGENQELASISDFVSKIKAGQDAKLDKDFCIVARTEALVSGYGEAEALKRIDAYCKAGADAILIHSKSEDGNDVLNIINKYQYDCPIVIVPTKYYKVPTQKFVDAGVSAIIWANHTLRASIISMKEVVSEIYKSQSLLNVENNIASLSEVFRLNGENEFRELEKKYLNFHFDESSINSKEIA